MLADALANVARRKMGMDWAETGEFPGALRGLLTVVPVTVETHEAGLALAERVRVVNPFREPV